MSKVRSSLTVSSKVTIELLSKDGKSVKQVYRNMIVNGGYDVLGKMMLGTATDFNQISDIGVGTGGHEPGDITTPVDPLITDTVLEEELARTAVSQRIQEDQAVQFRCIFADDEANDDITEAGLFSLDGVMFARVTFPAVHKDSGWFLVVTWEYTLSEGT